MNVHCVLNSHATLGEGPVWCPRRRKLYWIDILERKVHEFDPSTSQNRSFDVPSFIGSLALTENDRLLLVQHELAWLNPQDAVVADYLSLREPAGNRMNDGKCDAGGRFWVGSMNLKESEPTGILHRISRAKDEVMLDGLTIQTASDGARILKLMYLADSGAGSISVFDFDLETGTLRNRRAFVNSSPRGGVPDGLCVDTDGCVWVAFWDGNASRDTRPKELPILLWMSLSRDPPV